MFEKENRTIYLTPEEQRRKDAANLRKQQLANRQAAGLVKSGDPVEPETMQVETPTIFEGGSTDTSAFDAVIDEAETPPAPAAPPPPDTPLSYEDWRAKGFTAPGGYQGYLDTFTPAPTETAAPVGDQLFLDGQIYTGDVFTNKTTGQKTDQYGNPLFGSLEESQPVETPAETIPDPTEFQPDDDLYERNRKTNADNAARAASNPDYTYTPLPENPQEAMNMQLGEQAEEVAFQNAQNQITTELEDLGLEKIGESVVRSIASSRAQYVQGRSGGVYSSAKAKIPKAVADSANRVLKEAKLKIQSSRNRRDYYEKQMAKAHADKNTELVKYFQKQVAEENARILAYQKAAEADALSIEQGMAAAVRKEEEEAMERIDMLVDNPSVAAATSVADFETLAVQAGFTESVGNVFAIAAISKAKAFLKAQEGKEEQVIAMAEADYQKVIKSLENPIVAKIEGFKKLKAALEAGGITQEAFDALSVDLGYAEAELNPLETALKLADLEYKQAQTAGQRANAQEKIYNLNQLQGLADVGVDILGQIGVAESGATADEFYSSLGLDRLGGAEFKGECGAMVNDILGMTGKYKSTFESKRRNISPGYWGADKVVEGAVFISNLGANGHCGFVESVDLENQSVVLFDINRKGGQMTNRRPVKISDLATKEGIIGYENVARTMAESGGEAKVEPREELAPLYKKYNNGKLTDGDRKYVAEMGISAEDFSKQAFVSKSTSDEDVAGLEFANDIIAKANELKIIEGKVMAALTPWGTLPFTDARTFQKKLDAFISKLALNNLVELKSQGATFGALSDNELRFITDAATALDIGMDRKAFDIELDKIITNLEKAKKGKEPATSKNPDELNLPELEDPAGIR